MKRLNTCRQVRQFFNSLWNDTSGVILPYVTLLLVAIIGVGLLALDGARYMGLQTQLQNAADAYALAGAAELDRLPDSIDRANQAIDVMMKNQNSENVGDGAKFVTLGRRRFLSSLPASDNPITSVHETSDPTRARFIEVTVTPVAMDTILPATFLGLASTVTASARAVAEYDQVLCNAVPLLVCNPFEEAGMTNDEATQALVRCGQQCGGTTEAHPACRREQQEWPVWPRGFRIPLSGHRLPAGCRLRPRRRRRHAAGAGRDSGARLLQDERRRSAAGERPDCDGWIEYPVRHLREQLHLLRGLPSRSERSQGLYHRGKRELVQGFSLGCQLADCRSQCDAIAGRSKHDHHRQFGSAGSQSDSRDGERDLGLRRVLVRSPSRELRSRSPSGMHQRCHDQPISGLSI